MAGAGTVRWHFTMSLDGFVAGPDHDVEWMSGITGEEGFDEAEHSRTVGAVLGGRSGWDAFEGARPYDDAWRGEVFVLTHHPDDAQPAEGVTFLDCDVAEAVRLAREAAGGKDVEVLSPTVGAQLLERGLLDEIVLHLAPVLLGDGIRLYGPGMPTIRLDNMMGDDPHRELTVRYAPVR